MTSTAGQTRLEIMRAGHEAFISVERMAELEAALVAANFRSGGARRMLSSHLPAACPGCGSSGYYRWHFLGRFVHPACGHRWVSDPCRYMAKQVGWGVGSGVALAFDPTSVGQGGIGESMLVGCAVGLIRVPIAAMLLPVQTVVWLSSSRGARIAGEDGPKL